MEIKLNQGKVCVVEGLEFAEVVEVSYLAERKIFIIARENNLPQGLSENLIVSTRSVSERGMYGWYLDEYGIKPHRLIGFMAFDDVRVIAERHSMLAGLIIDLAGDNNRLKERLERIENMAKIIFNK